MTFNRDQLSEQLLQDFHEEDEDDSLEEHTSYMKIFTPLIVIGVAVFLFYAWYTDKFAISSNTEEAPLIRADKAPVRVKPDDPGGMEIENRDKSIYDTISSTDDKKLPKVIRLLPEAEQPVEREVISQNGELNPAGKEIEIVKVAKLLEELERNMPKPEADAENSNEAATPTEVVADNATAGDNKPVVEVKPAEAAKPAETAAAPVTAEKLIEKHELMSKDLQGLQEIPELTVDDIKTAPTPMKKEAAEAKTPKKSADYRIQIGAYRSESEVDANWGIVQKKNAPLLDKSQKVSEKADLGTKGVFYRLQVGGFDDETEARNLCKQLSEKGQGCFVVKK